LPSDDRLPLAELFSLARSPWVAASSCPAWAGPGPASGVLVCKMGVGVAITIGCGLDGV